MLIFLIGAWPKATVCYLELKNLLLEKPSEAKKTVN